MTGSGPAGRITKSDVLSAATGNGGASAVVDEPRTRGADGDGATGAAAVEQPLRGSAAALARYMEKSLSIPTATSFRTLTVTTLDARRRELKAAGQRVSFTHLIAYAIVRAAQEMPVMADHFAEIDGKPHRVRDGQVNLGLAVDVETQGRLAHADRAGHHRPRRRCPSTASSQAYDALVEKARTNALAPDDLVGANITLTNPGGLGTVASVPRLMEGQGTIVATGSISYPVGLASIGAMIGAEKVMTMTSTYDHRVIQGAESGRFLGLIEEQLHGEHGFYEDVFAALGVELGPLPPPPAPAAAAPRRPPPTQAVAGAPAGEELLQAVQAAATLHHALSQPRPPGGAPGPARLRARGRPRPGPRVARADARGAGADPGEASCTCTCRARRSPTRFRTCARPTAARSPTRSSTSPPTASACGCASTSSPAPSASR